MLVYMHGRSVMSRCRVVGGGGLRCSPSGGGPGLRPREPESGAPTFLFGRPKDRFVGGMSKRKNLFHYQNLCSQFRLMVNSYLTSLAVYVFFNIY